MSSYRLIQTLFKSVFEASKTIKGNFHLCPRYGAELNTNNFEKVLDETIQQNKVDKFPAVFMMPPVSAMDGDEIGEWERFRVELYFLNTTFYDDKNQTSQLNKNTNTSQRPITEEWDSMHEVARDFIIALGLTTSEKTIQEFPFRFSSEKKYFDPVSNQGNKRLSGVKLVFKFDIWNGCSFEDYPTQLWPSIPDDYGCSCMEAIANEALLRAQNDEELRQLIENLEKGGIEDHLNDYSNPHKVTLEQARSENNKIEGDIDADGNRIIGLANGVDNQDSATVAQVDQSLLDAKAYTDERLIGVFIPAGDWDACQGEYPTITNSGDPVLKGHTFRITVEGEIEGYHYDKGDSIYAIVDEPGQDPDNWGDFEHNTQQASETVRGTATIATATTVANENSLDDSSFITPKKLWQNVVSRFLSLAWTWTAKQIFNVSPKFGSVTANHYLKVDGNKELVSVGKIPMSDVENLKRLRVKDTTQSYYLQNQNAGTVETVREFTVPANTLNADFEINHEFIGNYFNQSGSSLSVAVELLHNDIVIYRSNTNIPNDSNSRTKSVRMNVNYYKVEDNVIAEIVIMLSASSAYVTGQSGVGSSAVLNALGLSIESPIDITESNKFTLKMIANSNTSSNVYLKRILETIKY